MTEYRIQDGQVVSRATFFDDSQDGILPWTALDILYFQIGLPGEPWKIGITETAPRLWERIESAHPSPRILDKNVRCVIVVSGIGLDIETVIKSAFNDSFSKKVNGGLTEWVENESAKFIILSYLAKQDGILCLSDFKAIEGISKKAPTDYVKGLGKTVKDSAKVNVYGAGRKDQVLTGTYNTEIGISPEVAQAAGMAIGDPVSATYDFSREQILIAKVKSSSNYIRTAGRTNGYFVRSICNDINDKNDRVLGGWSKRSFDCTYGSGWIFLSGRSLWISSKKRQDIALAELQNIADAAGLSSVMRGEEKKKSGKKKQVLDNRFCFFE